MNSKGHGNELKGCLPSLLGVLLGLIACLLITLISGCKTRYITKDVTVIETHDSVHYVHDTLFYEVPGQYAQVMTKDSVSVLENDFAVSKVEISKDGTLSHKLATKPQSVAVPFEKPVETRTQVVYKDREVPVEVERKLTRWERFKLGAGGWLVAVTAAAALILAARFAVKRYL